VIGYEKSEQLDVKPAEYFVVVTKREKRACKDSEEQGVQSAPLLGRRNWIHVGSREAGPRVAAIISIVETCRRLSLPVRDYLGLCTPGLSRFSEQSSR
jgi:hypothetical protein